MGVVAYRVKCDRSADVTSAVNLPELTRCVGELGPRVLLDGHATKAAVISNVRSHLGQAGPGDTALF